jgi:predicted Zn-dependent peptidase
MDTAHVMEHLVFGANREFKKSSKFSQEFCKNGAYNNAYTADYHTGYLAECAEFEAERILNLLCLAIESPLFLSSEFKAEIANVREELKSRKNSYDTELSLALEHALGFIPLTYKVRVRQLDAVRLQDIKEHYTKTHFTKNARFIIAGKITPHRQAIINRLESLQLPKGRKQISLPIETPVTLDKPLVMFHKGVDNLYYRWESVIPHIMSDIERDSLKALQDLLFNTFHSKIFGVARQKGLLYSLFANYYRTKDHHVWFMQGQVLPQNITALFELMQKQITEICSGKITNQEIEAVKLYGLGTFQRGIQTVDQLANWYSQDFEFDKNIRNFSDTPKRIKALTKTNIIDAAKMLFDNTAWGLGFLGLTPGIDTFELKTTIAKLYS